MLNNQITTNNMSVFGMAAMQGMGGALGASPVGIAQSGFNIFGSWLSNKWAKEREAIARKENFEYGEQAADAADMRTRALYSDLYSPQAQMQQIKSAGLSPSMFYGDMAGISGQSGAMGTGAAGISPTTFGVNPVELSQIALNNAQANKLNSESKQIDLSNEIKELENTIFKGQYKWLWNGYNINGKDTSLFELANDYYDFSEYIDKIRELSPDAITQENDIQILREIYMTNKRNRTDIEELANKGVSANFHKQLVKELQKEDYNNLTAKEAATKLRKSIKTDELSTKQTNAWIKLLKGLENKTNDKFSNAILLVGLILDRALTNYNPQKFEYHEK